MGQNSGRYPKRMSSRRNFLILGGLLGVAAGWRVVSPMVRDVFAGDFKFRPIKGMDGFREIEGSAVSALSGDPFIGLDTSRRKPARLIGRVEDALHFENGPGVPVAEFTDFNCPYCKILSPRLQRFADRGDITLSVHYLPLLGPGSVSAARFVAAASLIADTRTLHTRLMASGFRVDETYARAIAADVGFDVGAINPTDSNARLSTARALAARFGIIGTPALVVGRTLVIGEMSERRLARLIEVERSST